LNFIGFIFSHAALAMLRRRVKVRAGQGGFRAALTPCIHSRHAQQVRYWKRQQRP
jgi:hypothetical protein